jgi:hypothetical protein
MEVRSLPYPYYELFMRLPRVPNSKVHAWPATTLLKDLRTFRARDSLCSLSRDSLHSLSRDSLGSLSRDGSHPVTSYAEELNRRLLKTCISNGVNYAREIGYGPLECRRNLQGRTMLPAQIFHPLKLLSVVRY